LVFEIFYLSFELLDFAVVPVLHLLLLLGSIELHLRYSFFEAGVELANCVFVGFLEPFDFVGMLLP
jgi:hypothetical protein